MSVSYNRLSRFYAIFGQKKSVMVQSKNFTVGSITTKVKKMYAVGIAATLLVSVGHIAYTFAAYRAIDEPALWFFSGALAVLFNGALNVLCLRECTKLNHVIAMTANLTLLLFSLVLVIVIKEVQTVGFAVVTSYTTVLCYYHKTDM
jgi:hypothetical protein